MLENRAKYEGQWAVGTQVRCGKGKLVWPDGSVYEGWWKDSVACGRGRLLHSQGDIYIGDWNNDMAHGQGKYLRADGSTYEGQWVNGLQDGLGKLCHRDVVKIGLFKENRFAKDLSFIFEGLRVGVYGTFLKTQLNNRGAFNAPNMLLRSKSQMPNDLFGTDRGRNHS